MNSSVRDKSIELVKPYLSFVDKEYHNKNHAEFVAEKAVELAEYEGLSKKEIRLAEVAAWYHDVGHIYGPEEHESKSMEIAYTVLNNLDVSEGDISRIIQAIKTTNYPQDYNTDSVAQVVADADLISLGLSYDKFYKYRMEVYEEFEHNLTVEEWATEMGVPLLESQTYMTDIALEKYQPQVLNNLKRHRDYVKNGSSKVLVGGTFDMIHAGHKELLNTAFGYGNPTIGLTSDEIANESRERDVKPYNERYNQLYDLANELSQFYHREFDIVKLESKYDVSTSEDADIIVISPEPKTKERVKSINETRNKEGLNELEIIVSDEVYAYDGGRISSTRIRNNEIDKQGRNMMEY